MADLDELTRRARRAESDGELREAARLYRAALEADPDQEVAVRTARLLDRAERADEALDVLRKTWERRTGRRLPAGEIERAARRLDPDADLASWTPEWPPMGEDGETADRVAGTVEAAEPAADARAGDGRDGGRRPAGREAPRAEGEGRGRPGDEPADGGDDPEESDSTPSRRFVRRYERERGGDGAEEGPPGRLVDPREGTTAGSGDAGGDGGDSGDGADGVGLRRDPLDPADGRDAAGSAPPAANGAGDLRRGLEVLEDLLELSPRDRRLRRRKVRYARRLEDPGLLEEALVELGDLLEEEGARRGALLLYEEAGARGETVSPEAVSGPAGDSSPAEDVDEGFRRRLSEALEHAPRELERLQAAGMEALGAEGAGAVPWRAHRELGRFLLLRGRPDEAARHLAAARDRAPAGGDEAADVLYDLGLAYRRAGRDREARACFRRLAERDPGFAVAWEALSA